MDNLSTEEHIERLYKRIEAQADRISDMQKTIQKMLNAFLGDKQFGGRGYRQRIETNEDDLEAHEQRMNKMDERFRTIYQRVMGIALGVTIAALAIGWMVVNVKQAKGYTWHKTRTLQSAPLGRPLPLDSLKIQPQDSARHE